MGVNLLDLSGTEKEAAKPSLNFAYHHCLSGDPTLYKMLRNQEGSKYLHQSCSFTVSQNWKWRNLCWGFNPQRDHVTD
jgi:hypothetical protein